MELVDSQLRLGPLLLQLTGQFVRTFGTDMGLFQYLPALIQPDQFIIVDGQFGDQDGLR